MEPSSALLSWKVDSATERIVRCYNGCVNLLNYNGRVKSYNGSATIALLLLLNGFGIHQN